jgi:two-component system, OmpR family, response regulator
MTGKRLLIVEDDPRIVSFLEPGLRAEGYLVEVARDGVAGLDLARDCQFALIVLDYMLPGLDGLEFCQRLRGDGCSSLILMLTAKHGLQDKITALKGGADDYLTKPFAFGELLARIEALLRRRGDLASDARVLQVEDLTLDLDTKMVQRGGRRIDLTPKEFALLSHLMANAGTVVSRQSLLSNVWGLNFDPGTKVVDVYIRYLRLKLDRTGTPMIGTVRGFGYTMPASRD